MQVEVKKVNSANSKISAKISKNIFEDKKTKVANKIAKLATVKGFRKGKAPVKIIASMYGEEILNDARRDIIDEVIKKGLEDLNVATEALFGQPYLIDFKETDGGFDFEVSVNLKPTIELKDVASLFPAQEEIKVLDAEVDERVAEILKSIAPLEDVKEKRALANGDFATIDFEGFVDGEAFAGGKASDYALEIGSGSFIPGFEDGCVGMSVGEEREVSVKFPESYQAKNLAGKDAMFKVKLNNIQKRATAELNEEMAKQILVGDEEASAEKVKEKVKDQLSKEKQTKLYVDELKPAILDKLVEAFVFDLPDSVVEQEIDVIAKSKLQSLSEAELEAYKDAEKVKALREELKEEASKNVRITFIIDELARIEGVTATDQDVAQAIMMEAYQSGQEPVKLLEMYKSYNLLPAVKMALIEDRVLMKLLDNNKKA